MPAFTGFPSGKNPFVPLPETFFSVVLPQIENLGELKVVLHLFWRLYQKEGTPRCASDRELLADPLLRRTLKRQGDPRPVEERLRAALEQAQANGILLRVRVRVDDEIVSWYFFNTDRSRRAVMRLQKGELSPEVLLDTEGPVGQSPGSGGDDGLSGGGGTIHALALEVDRPNIFALYEQNVGLLLPLVAEELREAGERYPQEWIEEAFRLAAQQNKRKWSYIRAILHRWETDGKGA
ncbi:MAG TPA: DnaD domain protein [Ktedonobacterales bacterium]|nr:DnaD domain protein [Ktedonobacterales bacterium]